jgi:hypothetical protein
MVSFILINHSLIDYIFISELCVNISFQIYVIITLCAGLSSLIYGTLTAFENFSERSVGVGISIVRLTV